jgi:hypothetical protein
MAARKPFRTLKEPLFPPDSFTVEQARAAVIAVMKRRGIPIRPDVVERVRPRIDLGAAGTSCAA